VAVQSWVQRSIKAHGRVPADLEVGVDNTRCLTSDAERSVSKKALELGTQDFVWNLLSRCNSSSARRTDINRRTVVGIDNESVARIGWLGRWSVIWLRLALGHRSGITQAVPRCCIYRDNPNRSRWVQTGLRHFPDECCSRPIRCLLSVCRCGGCRRRTPVSCEGNSRALGNHRTAGWPHAGRRRRHDCEAILARWRRLTRRRRRTGYCCTRRRRVRCGRLSGIRVRRQSEGHSQP